MTIDSYRFHDFASRQVMKAWAAREEPGVIPFTPLAKPLDAMSTRDGRVPPWTGDTPNGAFGAAW